MKKHTYKRMLALSLAVIFSVTSVAGCGKKETSSYNEVAKNDETRSENLLKNGDFSDGKNLWDVYCHDGSCDLSVNDEQVLDVDIKSLGSVDYGVQLYHDGFTLSEGCVYRLTFDAYSDVERPAQMRFQINGGDYHAYYEEVITIGTENASFDYTFTMKETTDPAPRFCFNLGVLDGMDASMAEHHVYFDNFYLSLEDDSAKVAAAGDGEKSEIAVNQIGYLPSAYKAATVTGNGLNQTVKLINEATGESVLEASVGEGTDDPDAGEKEALFDFTSVKDEGTYHIEAGDVKSPSFVISKSVYDEALTALIKMLYYQRCGCELTSEYAGDFSHPICHENKASLYEDTSKKLDVSGGWHDAGDYGRYSVAGAVAAADLLLAYENYPDIFTDNIGIPESGNGTPDILDEAKYELDWLFKMQREDGGVYHKVTCKNFPGEIMPQDETDELYIMPVTTTATGDFAAVMAIASRVYKKYDKAYADKCLAAAKKAASYLDNTPHDTKGYKNPSDVSTGEYEDTNDYDERFWAYAELLKTTGEKSFDASVLIERPNSSYTLGWQGVTGYGAYAYMTADKASSAEDFKNKAKDTVENISSKASTYGYGSSIIGDYPWGSNLTIANNGELLLMLNGITDSLDKDTVDKQLNYLFGTNATGYCFLTGFGTLSPKNPHHRPSQVTGKCVPGMIVGGPNNGLNDPYVQSVCAGNPTAKCYADNSQSYSTNEVTIYWNSPVIYLLAGEISLEK